MPPDPRTDPEPDIPPRPEPGPEPGPELGARPGADPIPTGYADRRVAYHADRLDEADLAAHPLAQFERWYADAVRAGVSEPNAMVLATVDAAGAPAQRTVLLKQADPRGFVLYTNHGSRKGHQIEAGHGAVALLFPWHAVQRQVAVRGVAERLDRAETAEYWAQRPWGSRIGAWASRQSAPVAGRAPLEQRYAELAARWPDRGRPDDVPLPEHWGGYLVRAWEVEFWQGRPSRLHDRLVFTTVTVPAGPDPAVTGAEPRGPTAALDDDTRWRVLRRQP